MGAKIILKSAVLFTFCLLIFSCKKKTEKVLEEYTPLSKSAAELASSAQWAYELEGERLSKKIDSFESISRNVPLSPLAMAALEGGLPMRGVYPDLFGFENLDTSALQGELLETVRAFCLALIDYSKASPGEDGQKASTQVDALFYAKTIFSLSLFLADSEEAGPFEAFVVGRPFVGDDLMEIPVRLTGKDDYLFCKLYPVMQEDAWKIQQIEIYKREAKDGSGKTDRN